uniref:Uncharacterized protein n=1 Tax=Arundo donax TaxID=35708 RepID=A0A0A8YCU4_ARUDO
MRRVERGRSLAVVLAQRG